MTTKHESTFAEPWSIHDAPEGYIQKMLPAIVGVRIEVTSVQGQWKLSQNQIRTIQRGVIEGLSQLDNTVVSEVVEMVDLHSRKSVC